MARVLPGTVEMKGCTNLLVVVVVVVVVVVAVAVALVCFSVEVFRF